VTAPVPQTVIEILRKSTQYLRDHGSESARLDAELLCAHALGMRRLDCYLQFDRVLGTGELTSIRDLLRRRGQGEPVAYLIGVREFYGRDFVVNPHVLVPRPDTEVLIETVVAWARDHSRGGAPIRIADIGTGSGCIAVTLAAEIEDAQVVAVDVSADALTVAGRNAGALGVAERITFAEGSWCEPLAGLPPFDVVVSNPPYITDAEMATLPRDVADFEPKLALAAGADGLEPYRMLTASIPSVVRDCSLVALEIDPRRVNDVLALLREAMPVAAVVSVDDLTARPRLCCAYRE